MDAVHREATAFLIVCEDPSCWINVLLNIYTLICEWQTLTRRWSAGAPGWRQLLQSDPSVGRYQRGFLSFPLI